MLSLQKNSWVATKLGGAKLGACDPPGPSLKPTLALLEGAPVQQ